MDTRIHKRLSKRDARRTTEHMQHDCAAVGAKDMAATGAMQRVWRLVSRVVT